MKLYWDEAGNCITKDKSCAPVYKGTSLYIETYKIKDTNMQIDIAYSQFNKDNEDMYLLRQSILNQHNLSCNDLGDLVRLTVPEDVYESLVKKESEENKCQ